MTKKRIYLNAFEMVCAGAHQSPGLWLHEDDRSHTYKDSEYWIELAKLLEKGKFDAVFLADVLGTYDVYGGTRDAALRNAVQTPVNDPLLVVPLMSSVTEHLSFGVTASVSHEHPYTFARRMSTLDHLTKGRIGWNVVTSYLKSAAVNIGLDDQMSHDERYEFAAEYLDVCYKLWEGSWEDGAVVRDPQSKVYTDPSKVHDIRHEGKYFKVPGAHLSEPSPQRTPVLFQAGASPHGREFASKHAESVFTAGPTIAVVKKGVDALRERIQANGRDPEDVLVYTTFTAIVGKTEEEAQEKYETLKSHVSYEGALALLSGWTGIDFSGYEPDDTLEYIQSNAMQSAVEVFTRADPDRKWTIGELATFVGIGGRGPVAVGTPEQVADEVERWRDETGVDGFNLAYTLAPGSFEDFVELVVPVLQERGLVQSEYTEGTYREKIYGKGQAQLKDNHPGKNFKHLHELAGN
ncbi:LLM class flavin-dependent oxidoreductase [Planococcus maritimus]|uniref:LLM class flavin-dependent oxidoreductase n=1 Tax=Planococcus maritimus TaxID=192421 RepID=UPI0007942E5C|nr:LLM class flavin-dependent oxidoreductase [Planococcus maritimus]KYG58543.1 5,10-methylene tetrahydromethanopterin reductase [Planococcus maritimus]OED31717.1 5,10-methylene tetrahydromethanopterin reductase [Planococcus maritimus]